MSERNVAEPGRGLLNTRRHLISARRPLLACAIVLACATWYLAGDGVYSWRLVSAWLLGLSAWLAAWWPEREGSGVGDQGSGVGGQELDPDPRPLTPDPLRADPRPLTPDPFVTLLLLGFILVVAAFFCFYRLAEVPRNPTSDHAEKLLDVRDLLLGQRPIFFVRNTGREPAQFYWTLLLIRGFGFPFSWETLKWGTALIGLAAVPAVFLTGRELRGNAAGLIAAALFAIGKWPVNLSRAGLRYPLAILPAALVVWLLLRYLRGPDRRVALLCGIVLGLGLHGYSSFRIVPLLVPLFLGIGLLMDRQLRHSWRTVAGDGALIAATALLACLPLVRYGVSYPQHVWSRIASRAAEAERSLGGVWERLTIFAGNNLRALLAFNIRGDSSSVIAVSHDPLLDPVTGAAFVGGVMLAAYWAIRQRDTRCAALLLAVPVLLLPSTLNIAFPNENPSANRLGVAAVVVFPLAALPFTLLVRLTRRRRLLRIVSGAALAGVLVIAARHNYLRYFRDFDEQYRSFVPNTRAVAAAVEARLDTGIVLDDVYLLVYPHWLDGRNVAFALGDIDWIASHEVPAEAPLPARRPGASLVFILNAADTARLEQLQQAYPDGDQDVRVPPDGQSFVIYTVPPPAASRFPAREPHTSRASGRIDRPWFILL